MTRNGAIRLLISREGRPIFSAEPAGMNGNSNVCDTTEIAIGVQRNRPECEGKISGSHSGVDWLEWP